MRRPPRGLDSALQRWGQGMKGEGSQICQKQSEVGGP